MASIPYRRRCATMLTLLLVLTGAVFAQESTGSSGESEQSKRPKLIIEATEYSFGEVKQGTQISHSFIVRNAGTADLEIRSVRPG